MEVLAPLVRPLSRHGDRIVAENGFLCIIPLPEAYAFTTTKVNCRPDFHSRASQTHKADDGRNA